MNDQIIKFWMVLRDGTSYTSYRHCSKESAINEAKRLSLLAPENMFYVLELTNAYIEPAKEPKEIEVIDHPDSDLPF